MTSGLEALSTTIGWLYTVAWSVRYVLLRCMRNYTRLGNSHAHLFPCPPAAHSFYPQIWLNYKRKSVTGLSLEYQAYNITGKRRERRGRWNKCITPLSPSFSLCLFLSRFPLLLHLLHHELHHPAPVQPHPIRRSERPDFRDSRSRCNLRDHLSMQDL
jgi:hypothetical protein